MGISNLERKDQNRKWHVLPKKSSSPESLVTWTMILKGKHGANSTELKTNSEVYSSEEILLEFSFGAYQKRYVIFDIYV